MSDNGQVPADELEVVDTFGQRLRHATANSWHRMHDAAKAAGVSIWITKLDPASYPSIPDDGAIGAYRDLTVQEWLYRHPIGPVRIAPPGYSSHGEGTDADISTNDGNRWLGNHAHEFGWTQLFNSEAWHYHHDGATATAALNSTPLTQSKGLPDMELVRNTSDATAAPKYHGDVVLFDTHRIIRKLGAPSVYQPAADRFGIQDTVNDAQFLGRLNGFGWTAAEYDQVRALGASNAIGERNGDGTFHAYIANDVK